jgi:hypothetical protein
MHDNDNDNDKEGTNLLSPYIALIYVFFISCLQSPLLIEWI